MTEISSKLRLGNYPFKHAILGLCNRPIDVCMFVVKNKNEVD